jgi:hypothetical protein
MCCLSSGIEPNDSRGEVDGQSLATQEIEPSQPVGKFPRIRTVFIAYCADKRVVMQCCAVLGAHQFANQQIVSYFNRDQRGAS